MKSPLVVFAKDLGVRTAVAFAIGILAAVFVLVSNGTLHDAAAHHSAAQLGGQVTLWCFIILNAWWLPRMFRAETESSKG